MVRISTDAFFQIGITTTKAIWADSKMSSSFWAVSKYIHNEIPFANLDSKYSIINGRPNFAFLTSSYMQNNNS